MCAELGKQAWVEIGKDLQADTTSSIRPPQYESCEGMGQYGHRDQEDRPSIDVPL